MSFWFWRTESQICSLNSCSGLSSMFVSKMFHGKFSNYCPAFFGDVQQMLSLRLLQLCLSLTFTCIFSVMALRGIPPPLPPLWVWARVDQQLQRWRLRSSAPSSWCTRWQNFAGRSAWTSLSQSWIVRSGLFNKLRWVYYWHEPIHLELTGTDQKSKSVFSEGLSDWF